MIGYPKRIGCEQDLINLMEDYPNEVKKDLERIQAHDAAHATVTRVISGSEETKDLKVETIANPCLISKQLGIKKIANIDAMLSEVTTKINIGKVDDIKIEDAEAIPEEALNVKS